MRKNLLLLTLASFTLTAQAEDLSISTPNSTLIISTEVGKSLKFGYYGSRAEVEDVRAAGRMLDHEAFPAYGKYCNAPFASLVKHSNGDNAMYLLTEKIEQSNENGISKISVWLIPIKFRFDVASMCRLGMEMIPAMLNDAERAYAKRAIAEYKNIRSVVQQGDLYRIISPYEGERNFSSLMYVSEAKDRAVLFAYRHLIQVRMSAPIIRLHGLKADAKYRIREVAPEKEGKPVTIDGKVINGKVLIEEGIVIPELTKSFISNKPLGEVRGTNDWRSVVLELTEIK